jgi:lipopolysaccharide exporter
MNRTVEEIKRAFLQKLREHRGFGLNISVLAGGTFFAQLIYVLSSPLLTRLYSPEGFGVLAAFTALATTTAVFATLRYDLAVMLPKQNEEAVNLVFLTILISLFTSLILGLGGILYREKIGALFKATELSLWMVFFPLGVLSLCFGQIFRMWWYRQNRFNIGAASVVIQAGLDTAIKIGAAVFFQAGSVGLLVGYIVGLVAADVLLLSKVQYSGKNGLFGCLSLERMVSLGARFKTFPLYNSWAELVSSVSLNLPTLLLTFMFSPYVAGLYILANRVLKIPARILGLSVSQALMKEITLRRNGNLSVFPFLSKVFMLLLILIALPFTALVLVSKGLFVTIFGAEWKASGEYAAVMAPWIAMQFVSLSVSSAYPALEKNANYAAVQFLLLLSATCPLLVSYGLGFDALRSVTVLSTANFIVNALFGVGALIIGYRHDVALQRQGFLGSQSGLQKAAPSETTI